VVFVSSIPNVYQLWALLRNDPAAQLVWALAGICQSMLSPRNTEQNRQTVLARERAFNDVLSEVCSLHAMCRFDNLAVFNTQFTPSQVSTLDYFHPSLSGQATLASITWASSWWGSAR
jgi:hypothetical protein